MVLRNPPSRKLGEVHVALNGRGRRHYVQDFPGPLSIKSVVHGSAIWQTNEGQFEIGPGATIVVNDRQPYTMIADSRDIVETFCIFFERGFVEDIHRTMTTTDAVLLADPLRASSLEFRQRVRSEDSVLLPLLRALYKSPSDAGILKLAEALVSVEQDALKQAERLPAAKASTRDELLRRLEHGRNVMEGSITAPLSLAEIARQSALSPFHFHRTFKRIFGETPHEYIARRRLERAAELLQGSDRSVTEVCLACGFQSLGSFSTLFAKYAGASPLAFRRKKLARTEKLRTRKPAILSS